MESYVVSTDSKCILCHVGEASGSWQLCGQCRANLAHRSANVKHVWPRSPAWGVCNRAISRPRSVKSTAAGVPAVRRSRIGVASRERTPRHNFRRILRNLFWVSPAGTDAQAHS